MNNRTKLSFAHQFTQFKKAIKAPIHFKFSKNRPFSQHNVSIQSEGKPNRELLTICKHEDNGYQTENRNYNPKAYQLWQSFINKNLRLIYGKLPSRVDRLDVFIDTYNDRPSRTKVGIYSSLNNTPVSFQSNHKGIIIGKKLKQIINTHIKKLKGQKPSSA